MSTTTTERPDVAAYLAAVRAELADLRPEERDEILLDVEASIVDAAEETDAPIAARLGPPADFAAELRAAAGLGPAQERRTIPIRDLWMSSQLVTARRVARELAPIWWVARAYVVVWLVAWIVAPDQRSSVPAPAHLGSPRLVLFLLAAAVVASIAVGLSRRRSRAALRVGLAVNLVLAVAAVPAFGGLFDWLQVRPARNAVLQSTPTPGLAVDGVPIENVYVFTRSGRPVFDVLLYDHYGRPLAVRPGDVDPSRRVLRTKGGASIFNSFPIRHYEPGTRRVARPFRVPRIAWSPIVTPPLERRAPRSP